MSEESKGQFAIYDALHGVALCYELKGDYSTALKYYQRAYRLSTESNNKLMEAHTLTAIAVVQWRKGDFDVALEELNKCALIAESIGSQQLIAETHLWIGTVYYSKHALAEAEAALMKSIEIVKETGHAEILWSAYHKVALVDRDSGKTTDAIRWLKDAVEVIEDKRNELNLDEQKSGFFQSKVDVYEDLVMMFVSKNQVAEAFEYAQRSKARGFVEMIAEADIDPEQHLNPELRERKKKMLSDLVDIHSLLQQENEKDKPDKIRLGDLIQKENELQNDYTKLVVEIRQQNPQYASVQYPQPLKITDAQALLDEETVLLEYFVGKTRSMLFYFRDAYQVPPGPS